MKNKLDDLRNHLFAALEGLSDRDNPMPIDRALAIAEVSQTIINTAKVEVDFLRLHNKPVKGTGFVPVESLEPLPAPRPGVRAALNGGREG